MTIHASNLDIERFRKVHALMKGGATEGERAAAKARATVMARKAGMTLSEAASKLDARPEPQSANPFEGFDDWMEAREPGYKVKRARERAEREEKRQAQCRELLKEFGSEEAVFAETERERLLRVTLDDGGKCGAI